MLREKKKRILVVDKNGERGSTICKALLGQGYRVERDLEVRKAIKSFKPHLVVLSEEFFDKATIDFIRQQEMYVHVVVISESFHPDSMVRVLQAGADDCVCRPIDFHEFFVCIHSNLKSNDLHRKLLRDKSRLQRLTDLDYLTGLYNMRSIYDRIDGELQKAKKTQSCVACVMLDMDNFKSVNDKNSHLFGSFVITQIGKLISQMVEKSGFAARYGGDEFLIVLTKVSVEEIEGFCEHLRKSIQECCFEDGKNKTRLTVSLGYVLSVDDPCDSRELVRRADHALYQAKESGKNAVKRFYLGN